MIAAEVYGLSRVYFSTHQNNSIFEGHGEVDLVVMIEVENTLDDCIMCGFEP